MILTVLIVNGTARVKESNTVPEARAVADEWLEEAKKHFPHKEFIPKFYIVAGIVVG